MERVKLAQRFTWVRTAAPMSRPWWKPKWTGRCARSGGYTGGVFRVSAYQMRGELASAKSAQSAEVLVPIPTVNSFQGGIPNSQLTFDGPAGATVAITFVADGPP